MSEHEAATQTAEQPRPVWPDAVDESVGPLAHLPTVVPPRVQVLPPSQPAVAHPVLDLSPLRWSQTRGKLIAALAAAQAEFGEVERTLQATIESRRTGGKFSYAYAPLDEVLKAVRPALSKHGIALLQAPFTRATSVLVRTVLCLGEEWVENDLVVGIDGIDPKSVGSGVTYACRYGVQAMVAVAPAYDDDGEAASRHAASEGGQHGHRNADGESLEALMGHYDADVQPRIAKAFTLLSLSPAEARVHLRKHRGDGAALLAALKAEYEQRVKVQPPAAAARRKEGPGPKKSTPAPATSARTDPNETIQHNAPSGAVQSPTSPTSEPTTVAQPSAKDLSWF